LIWNEDNNYTCVCKSVTVIFFVAFSPRPDGDGEVESTKYFLP